MGKVPEGTTKCAYVGFLAFDDKKFPINDNSLDTISGLSNIPGHGIALRKAFRVLKPCRALCTADGSTLREEIERAATGIPERVRTIR